MGCDKLLLPWGKKTVIEAVLAVWQASRVGEIVVVLRGDQQELMARCQGARVSIAIADPPPPEMKDSIAAGLGYVSPAFDPSDTDVWLLAPADMPTLSTSTIDRLLSQYEPSAPAILVPVISGKRGHPVLFPWRLAAAVRDLSADEGVNALLRRSAVIEIPCDGPVESDLDTREDYERLRRKA